MKAYRVWCVFRTDGVETIASTAYELEERANAIRDRFSKTASPDVQAFEVREEQVPGRITVNGAIYKTNIVVKGHDDKHTRFEHA